MRIEYACIFTIDSPSVQSPYERMLPTPGVQEFLEEKKNFVVWFFSFEKSSLLLFLVAHSTLGRDNFINSHLDKSATTLLKEDIKEEDTDLGM